jgi:hypothetical protein
MIIPAPPAAPAAGAPPELPPAVPPQPTPQQATPPGLPPAVPPQPVPAGGTPPPFPQIDPGGAAPLGAPAQGYAPPGYGAAAPVPAAGGRWQTVATGLAAASGGALAGTVFSGMMLLGFLIAISEPGFSETLMGILTFLMGVGGIGLYSTLIVSLTSWCVCLSLPDYRHKPPIQAAVAVMVVALLILASFFVFFGFGPALLRSADAETTAKLLLTGFALGVAGAFCAFSAFVRSIALRFHRHSVAGAAMGHMVCVGSLALWILLCIWVILEEGDTTVRNLCGFIILAGFVGHFIWMWSLARGARQAVLRR